MAGLFDCITLIKSILEIKADVQQNKVLCARLLRRVSHCGDILREYREEQHQELIKDAIDDLRYTLPLVKKYVKGYTEKVLGRSIIRVIYAKDHEVQFEELRDRLDHCIDLLPIGQNIDNENRRREDFEELKNILNSSVNEILSSTHDNNRDIVNAIDEFKQDIHSLVTHKFKELFCLEQYELTSLLGVVIDNKAALENRQNEILSVLDGFIFFIQIIYHHTYAQHDINLFVQYSTYKVWEITLNQLIENLIMWLSTIRSL